MNKPAKIEGRCFCNAVEFTLSGDPMMMGYCHCESCRRWSGGQVNSFTLWPANNFAITRGADNIGTFNKLTATKGEAGFSDRKWCKTCGGHVYIDHPALDAVDIPAVLLENFGFEPGFHIHYQEAVLPMKDGLTKFRDLPAAAGGSGEELPE